MRLIRRQNLEAAAEAELVVSRSLLRLTNSNLQHVETHLLLLGRKNSLERVVAFLLEMDERLTATGVISLPMSRRDIADYLCLTLETVSRAVSQLYRKGALDFIGSTRREIVILDRDLLESFGTPS